MALVPLLLAVAGLPADPSGRRTADVRLRHRFLSAGASRSRRGFLLGLTAGAAYFAGTLYWITDVMVAYGGLSWPVGVFLNFLLVAYLALFPAAFAVGAALLTARMGPIGLLLTPAIWVTTELGRRYLFGGFPWTLLGYSQVEVLPIVQLASLAGVYGVTGLVAFVNACIAYAFLHGGRARLTATAAACLSVLVVAGWGSWRIQEGSLLRGGTAVRVAMIQGNIAQEDKWNRALSGTIMDRYVSMSRDAAAQGARLILWPESATPFFFEEDPQRAAAVRQLARDTGAHLLIGSDQLERTDPPKYYNAAFLVRPDGATATVYRKIHLVPFGEYVPLKRLLFFAGPLVESVSDFSAGETPVILPVGGQLASTAICYEVIYPDLIRSFVVAGSQLLTTITNDAWYGRSSAPHQHFAQAAMRAVEQGRFLVRAANTGISGIVDPYGRILSRSRIFETATIVADVQYRDSLTIYGASGDVFAYLCALLTAGAVLAGGRGRQ